MTGKFISKYSYEISIINQILNELKQNKFYDETKSRNHGYLETNIKELQRKFDDLLNKMDNDINSDIAKTVRRKRVIEENMEK